MTPPRDHLREVMLRRGPYRKHTPLAKQTAGWHAARAMGRRIAAGIKRDAPRLEQAARELQQAMLAAGYPGTAIVIESFDDALKTLKRERRRP